MIDKQRSPLIQACQMCRYGTDIDMCNDDEMLDGYVRCEACIGDHTNWEPSKRFLQFMMKHRRPMSDVLHSMTKTKIVIGFPGIGKTWVAQHRIGINALDIDDDRIIVDEGLVTKCMEAIHEAIGKKDLILVSTCKAMQDAIYNDSTIMSTAEVYICYPRLGQRDAWVQRLRDSGKDKDLCDYIWKNYDHMVGGIMIARQFQPIELDYDQNLADVLVEIGL